MKFNLWVVKVVIILFSFISSVLLAEEYRDWDSVLERAKGQRVYFNAWGGDAKINRYIEWAGQQLEDKYGVELVHVKIDDTANVVNRVKTEKQAGKDKKGSVDLIWINGENFSRMKRNGLLFGPVDQLIPNNSLINYQTASNTNDFGTPTDGLEIPWGGAQFVFIYDSEKIDKPPKSAKELLTYLKANKGKYTYIKLPNFYGTTFLKQILYETIADPKVLSKDISSLSAEELTKQTESFWSYLDELHPLLYKEGKVFPLALSELEKLYNNGVVDIYNSFNPNDAGAGILQKRIKPSSKTYIHKIGGVGNTHFLAIPYNSGVKEGALVTIDFLASVEAQARKNDFQHWGDPTVLDLNKLKPAQQELFSAKEVVDHILPAADRSNILIEPHSSWVGLD